MSETEAGRRGAGEVGSGAVTAGAWVGLGRAWVAFFGRFDFTAPALPGGGALAAARPARETGASVIMKRARSPRPTTPKSSFNSRVS
jgi:hypothetical protein